MHKYFLTVFIFAFLAGCIDTEPGNRIEDVPHSTAASDTPVITPDVLPSLSTTAAVKPSVNVSPYPVKQDGGSQVENLSEAVEVNYREYVDWFMAYNLNIRAYTPDEYVCGQYTVDMINASGKAGFKAYFGAVKFSDGTGHALVAFKSTHFGITSWYFFEPQTNNQMNPSTIKEVLQDKMGKTVTEVIVYGYYDDAGDKDPSTWRFAYPLYDKKY